MAPSDVPYDVAIVGAGPAGAMAGRRLAAQGLRTVLLDIRRTVGRPVQCGEAVSEAALRENGVPPDDWVVASVRGVCAFGPEEGAAFLPAPGFCIDRRRFDAALVEASLSRGAELRAPCRVRRVRVVDGVCALETSRGPVRARYTVAADGPRSPTARSLGLVTSDDCHLGLQYRFPADVVDVDPEWLHLHLAARYEGGYAWIFPRGDQTSVGVDVPRNPRDHLAAFLETLGLDPALRQGTNGGRIPVRVRLRRLGEDNVLAIGDAAGATNPIFGGGIHAALATGRMAAESIVAAEETGEGSAGARYRRRAASSPFFHPVLPAVASLLHRVSDAEIRLALDVYRHRHRPMALLRTLAGALLRPRLLRRLVELPRLRRALEVTARYGW